MSGTPQRRSASRSVRADDRSLPRATTSAVKRDPTAEFFDKLGSRGHEPLLRKVSGSARFDVVDGGRTQRWLVTIDKGDIAVSRRSAGADAVLRADKASLDRAVAGKLNVFAALMRGEVTFRGNPRLLVHLQRLFPRPSGPTRSAR